MRFPISTFAALSAYLLASTLTSTSAYRPPPGGNGWSLSDLDRMTFSYVSKEDLVKELISPDGDVLIRNIEAADHIEQCAARFSGGHKLGRKYAKDKSRDSFTLATQGPDSEWILTDEHLLMDEGIILSSGIPDQLNWQHGDGWTKDFGKQGDPHLQTTVKENSHVVGYASTYVWDTFDACWISFEFKCNSTAYIPEVSFDYIFGSEEYYEYVYSDFNDAFGFYIYTEVPEVPLASRTFSSEAENIARIPNPGWYFRDGTECVDGETRTETSSAGTVVVQCEQFDIVSINNVNYNRNWRDYFNGNDPEASGFSYGPDGEQVSVSLYLSPSSFEHILTCSRHQHQTVAPNRRHRLPGKLRRVQLGQQHRRPRHRRGRQPHQAHMHRRALPRDRGGRLHGHPPGPRRTEQRGRDVERDEARRGRRRRSHPRLVGAPGEGEFHVPGHHAGSQHVHDAERV